jgi:hypothetical protein
MGRTDLELLSKAELIDLVLRLQQPAKTSRTSSKPPSTDRKAQRDKSRPGGAKPGHEGHSRRLSEDFDQAVESVIRINALAVEFVCRRLCSAKWSANTTRSTCPRFRRWWSVIAAWR